MKCIHCGDNSTYPQRSSNGQRCPTCQHPFAFEPKGSPLGVSDPLFQKCIEAVSQEGTLQFTERHLYYEFSRRVHKKAVRIPPPYGWAAAGLGAGGGLGAILGFPFLLPVGIIGMIAACVVGAKSGKNHPQGRISPLSFDAFRSDYLTRWRQTHGDISGLLMSPSPSVGPPPSRAETLEEAPDITAYSFDRVLVVDHADVAAMLVANRFHFENNCAIVSLDRRFPANGRFEQVLTMLGRNPLLMVFALHNGSVEGLQTVQTLREEGWFPNPTVRIADLGLRPRDAEKSAMLLCKEGPQTLSKAARAGLQAEEIRFLEEGYTIEIEAMRPAKLMRAIYQAFGQMVTVGPDGGLVMGDTAPGIWVGDGYRGYGSGDGVYAADSFG